MDVMASCYKHWTDMILSGEKPFEFRGRPWKKIEVGDKFYLYESKKHGGAGMVVGEATIEKIIPIVFSLSPQRDTFHYWAEHIVNRPDIVAAVDKIGDFRMSHYKDGYIYTFMLCDPILDYILVHDELPPTYNTIRDLFLHPELYQSMDLARKAIQEYDEWMHRIGFWNEYGESTYTIAYQLKDPIRYKKAKPVTMFCGSDGKPITKAPQSFQYVG